MNNITTTPYSMMTKRGLQRTHQAKSKKIWPRGFNNSILIILSISSLIYVCFTIGAFMHLPDIPSHRTLQRQTSIGHVKLPPSTKPDYKKPLTKKTENNHAKVIHAKDFYAFPQSVHDKPFEDINHPGHAASYTALGLDKPIPQLSVPTFWEPPGGRSVLSPNGQPMTPSAAHSVGSHYRLNSTTELETIFMAIASYRDFQCRETVHSAFSRAEYPERLRVGVVDQIDTGANDQACFPKNCDGGRQETEFDDVLCKYKHQIDIYTMEAKLAVGPVFARHLGHRMYKGEYFVVQSDAHVTFINNWDTDIISQWNSAKNEMAVLTAYLSQINDSIDKDGNRLRMSRPIMCQTDFEGRGEQAHLEHGQQPEDLAYIIDEPTLEPYWAAGFSFSRGHFVVNVPYDQHLPLIFQGEEINIGLRGWTYGYDYYTARLSVCFHWYAIGNEKKRDSVHKFWENTNQYPKAEPRAMNRLLGIIHMGSPLTTLDGWDQTDIEKYGLGKSRTLEKFFELFGIHVKEKTVEKHLCNFVGHPMMKEFRPLLRENGMGLDYSKTLFKFVDPLPRNESESEPPSQFPSIFPSVKSS